MKGRAPAERESFRPPARRGLSLSQISPFSRLSPLRLGAAPQMSAAFSAGCRLDQTPPLGHLRPPHPGRPQMRAASSAEFLLEQVYSRANATPKPRALSLNKMPPSLLGAAHSADRRVGSRPLSRPPSRRLKTVSHLSAALSNMCRPSNENHTNQSPGGYHHVYLKIHNTGMTRKPTCRKYEKSRQKKKVKLWKFRQKNTCVIGWTQLTIRVCIALHWDQN